MREYFELEAHPANNTNNTMKDPMKKKSNSEKLRLNLKKVIGRSSHINNARNKDTRGVIL